MPPIIAFSPGQTERWLDKSANIPAYTGGVGSFLEILISYCHIYIFHHEILTDHCERRASHFLESQGECLFLRPGPARVSGSDAPGEGAPKNMPESDEQTVPHTTRSTEWRIQPCHGVSVLGRSRDPVRDTRS